MSKKRRRGGPTHVASGPGEPKDSESKLKAITTYEDVADSEDEFFINQDKVLLDGTRPARSKQQYGVDMLEFSDQEVLEVELSDSKLEDTDEELQERESKQIQKPTQSKSSHKARSASTDEDNESNTEEEVEGWGRSKRDYYNQDDIETERDALEEEQEALRLQQKRLKQRNEADFGLDDDAWLSGTKPADGGDVDPRNDDTPVTQVLPDVEITEEMGAVERKRLLDLHFPEFDPLAKEFLALQPLHVELAAAAGIGESTAATAQHDEANRSNAVNVAGLKYEALTAYLGALSMYFALLTSATSAGGKSILARSSSEIRDHPIMDTLLVCRQTWESIKDLQEVAAQPAIKANRSGPTPAGEVANEAVESTGSQTTKAQERPLNSRKRKRQAALEAAQAEQERQHTERLRKTEEELAALSSLTQQLKTRPLKPSKGVNDAPLTTAGANDDSDLGEDTTLTTFEAAEKARKKKTLRFYTSQIAQKASKRTNAGRDAGGDADIPVRERLRDRQARLNALAEKRGKRGESMAGDALDAAGADHDDDEPHDNSQPNHARGDDDEDYYDMIAASTKKRKLAKEESRNATTASGQLENGTQYPEETVGPDGKRAISYAIEKNKGLAPKRKKDVRNPRVKKRKKFAEKQKKLGSVRQVYKGGEQRGGYGGEATGIKTRLVKSVKL